MSRALPNTISEAVGADRINVFWACDLEFDAPNSLHFWSGLGDLTIGDVTYTGAGDLLGISELRESSDIAAYGATLTLSGIPSELVSLAKNEPYQGRAAAIHFGVFKPFERASVATYFDADGVLRTAAIDELRADTYAWDGSAWVSQGVLIEGAATNHLLWSEDLTKAAWAKTLVSDGVAPVVTANQAIAPDGEMTADRVVFDGGTTGQSTLSQTIPTLSLAGDGTFSIWMRTASGTATIQLRVDYSDPTGSTATNVTVTEQWQRFSISAVNPRIASIRLRPSLGTSNTATLFVWGADLKGGDAATSYVKTEGATATRAADNRNGVREIVTLFSGQMDTMTIDYGPETSTIALDIESRLVRLTRPIIWRYTDADQKKLFPNDRFFEFVTDMEVKGALEWQSTTA